MSVLNEIAAKLAALSLGTVGTTIHIGRIPATPDTQCAVYEYPGLPPEGGMGVTGIQFEYPSVQVVFRGAAHDYATPRASAETAFQGLADINPSTTLSGTVYHQVWPAGSPFVLKRDEAQRVLVAINFRVMKEPSP